jgi:hypothetical protein
MDAERRFCSNCGQPVSPGARFCAACGTALAFPAAEPAAPPPSRPTFSQSNSLPVMPPSEPVLGAFLAGRKTGMFTQESMHVIVTNRRLIFAAFTNEMVKQGAKEEGKGGFLAGMLGAATLGYHYYKRYLNIPPDSALRENPQNFALERATIRKVKLEMGRRQVDKTRHIEQYEAGKLEIETTGSKHTFSIPHDFHNLAASALRQAGIIQ